MKVFSLIILINSFLFVSVKAQTKIDTCHDVTLKGYVITQYKRSDIKQIRNASNRIIDFYHRAYFVPIGNNTLDQIAIDSINVFNPDGIYFLPSKETGRLMTKYCNNYKNDLSSSSSKKDLSSFFQIGKKQNEYLYKIHYSECKAMKSRIPNNSLNAFQLNIPFDKKGEFLTCYFIYQDIILEEIEKISSENFLRVQREPESV